MTDSPPRVQLDIESHIVRVDSESDEHAAARLICDANWAEAKNLTIDNVVLGIGGGVGPSAGLGLHQKIIQSTEAGGQDQGHFMICHVSRASQLADRTEYLLGNSCQNPAVEMVGAVRSIAAAIAQNGDYGIVAIPCNTFHAPLIWQEFIRQLLDAGVDTERVRVCHLIDETLEFLDEAAPSAKNIGLMSTTGTRRVGVYEDAFASSSYNLLQVNEAMQSEVHEAIYNADWGLKARSPATQLAKDSFDRMSRSLIEAGAEAIILGCTEIPLALESRTLDDVPLIDPVEAVARSMIRHADVRRLRPLTSAPIARPSATPR